MQMDQCTKENRIMAQEKKNGFKLNFIENMDLSAQQIIGMLGSRAH